MLKWDMPEMIEGLTVYRDDVDWTLYYVFPNVPTFRIDGTGNPVFKFLKYRAPIDRPGGKQGGGFLVCDVEFTVPQAQQDSIKAKLQERIDEEWRRQNLPAPAPRAKLGQLSYTRGGAGVTFLDSSGALIEKITNPASPSLYGKMITPITIEMTPQGATLAEQALQGKGGVLQVTYDLWTPVKLPPLQARVFFEASKFMEFYQDINVEEYVCGEDDYREQIRETFIQREISGVEINPGTVTDQKVLQGVRDWAWKSLDDAVTRMVLGDIPAQNPEELRKLYNEQDIENATREVISKRIVSFNRSYDENMVMEWNPGPRGTLPNITGMVGPDGKPYKWEDYAATVDLDDPFFKELRVSARANADFDRLPLDSVEIKVEYPGVEPAEFQLRKADEVGKFAAYVDDKGYQYKYSYRINYKGETEHYQSEVIEDTGTSLVVNVGDTGILLVDVAPGDLSFDQVKSAQVHLWYEDAENQVGRIEQVFNLDKDHTDHHWTAVIFKPRSKPYHYKVKYFMADGREFVSAEQQSGTPKLWINDPFSASRTVNVRGFGDFEKRIDTIFVDLTYYDEANDYTQTKSTALTKGDTFEDWTFPVISAKNGKLTYSANIRFKDGTVEAVPATVADSDTIMLGDVLLSRDVTVMADLIDFTTVKLIKVTLHYVDEKNGLDQSDDLVFKKAEPGPKTWAQSYKDKKNLGYQWSAQYFFADGKTARIAPQDTVEETIVLPERPA